MTEHKSEAQTRHGNENALSHPIRAEVLTWSGQESRENQSESQGRPSCFTLCGSQTCLQTLGSWGRPVLGVLGLSPHLVVASTFGALVQSCPEDCTQAEALHSPISEAPIRCLCCYWLGSCSHDLSSELLLQSSLTSSSILPRSSAHSLLPVATDPSRHKSSHATFPCSSPPVSSLCPAGSFYLSLALWGLI